MGLNVVRIPLNYRWFEAGADGAEAPGWAILDRTLDWCEAVGVRRPGPPLGPRRPIVALLR